MKAVIVAAGISSRLYPLTKELPKCLLEFSGKSLIKRSVDTLKAHGIDEVLIVVGFERNKIIQHLGNNYKYITNPYYKINNNMASLGFAKPFVESEAFVYLHSDLLYHPDIITLLNPLKEANLHLVDKTRNDVEAMKVHVRDGIYVESSKEIPLERSYGEWLGISKFTAATSSKLFGIIDDIVEEGYIDCYDTSAFNRMVDAGEVMPVADVDGLPWIEIDFHDDLRKAREDIINQIE
jgi:choline kinase